MEKIKVLLVGDILANCLFLERVTGETVIVRNNLEPIPDISLILKNPPLFKKPPAKLEPLRQHKPALANANNRQKPAFQTKGLRR